MSETLKLTLKGSHVVDTVKNVKTGEVKVFDRGNNLVVNKILPLITSLLKGSLSGIQYWAVGSGASSWDTAPVTPSLEEVKLTNEIGRKIITASNIKFVDASTLEESTTPTTCLEVTCTFYEQDCNGVWREFGLFGGNATATKDSGYMIDKKHHAIFTKTEEMIIDRKIYLTVAFA